MYTTPNLIQSGRIQDFPGHQPQRIGDANLLFVQIFLKTAWKWRKLNRERGASKILLCRSTTVKCHSLVTVQNYFTFRLFLPVADPGFNRGGGVPTLKVGVKTTIWTISPQKLHENERNWTGGIPGAPSWIPQRLHKCGRISSFRLIFLIKM